LGAAPAPPFTLGLRAVTAPLEPGEPPAGRTAGAVRPRHPSARTPRATPAPAPLLLVLGIVLVLGPAAIRHPHPAARPRARAPAPARTLPPLRALRGSLLLPSRLAV